MPKLFGLCRSRPPGPRGPAGGIPRDPLGQGLRDAAEVESFLAVAEAYAQELSGTLSRLKQIPSPLVDGFKRSVMRGSAEEDAWELFAAQLDVCISRVAGSMSHLEALLLFIPRIRPRFAQIEKAAAKREESWAIKVRHDREVEEVKMRKISYEEKSMRLNASLQAADNFQSSTTELQAAIDAVLSSRSSDATTALQLFSECYAGIFGGETRPSLGSASNGVNAPNEMANGNESFECVLTSLDPSHCPPDTNSREHAGAAASTKVPPPPVLSAVSEGARMAPPAAQGSAGGDHQQSSGSAVPLAPTPVRFAPGERVEIWSSSQNKWLEGVVKEVFARGGTHEEYYVPAGVVKVESAAGTKFVQPDQQASVLRKLPS